MVIVKKVEKEELPKWLPEGWSMELRPRIRGEHFPKPNGGTYQCYIAPITNFKFYSKPEVFRYLQSSRNRRAAGSSNKTTTNGNTNKPFEVKKEELPDWLPEGWSMEIRPRMRGECFPKPEGGTYACYIAPVTNFKFYSKPEVFQHLQSSGDRRTRSSNKTTNGNTNKSTTKPAELPAMRRSKKSIRRRAHENQARDSKLKLHTGGEVDQVPDCEVKKIGYTKATIRRTIALQEQNRLHKRIKAGYFPGKDWIQGDFTSAETDVPDAVSGNITTDGEDDNGSKQLTSDHVDQLMENEMDTAAYEGPVNKLSNSIFANSKSLKCMQCSEVHTKEERLRNALKQLQGPVLPAGYIPQSPRRLSSTSNHCENAVKPLDSPFHNVSTDPCIISTRTMRADTFSTQGDKARATGNA